MKRENEYAFAEFLLKEFETKQSLRTRVNESVLEYYLGRHLFGLVVGLFIFGVLVRVSASQNIPFWGVVSLVLAITALMESKRNSGRVYAMIMLSNLSHNEPADADKPM